MRVPLEDQIFVLPEKLFSTRNFRAQQFLNIFISDEDVMEDQIYVLPERWIAQMKRPFHAKIF